MGAFNMNGIYHWVDGISSSNTFQEIYYACPEPLSPEELSRQQKQQVLKARRMEAFYRQSRLARMHELKEEKIELAEDGVVVNKFLLGCDPEFVALNEAGEVINVNGILTHDGEVGWDHSGHVIEVRPKPAKGAYALIKRMQKLLKNPRLAQVRCAKFRAGAYIPPYTLGGHVHLGIDARGDKDQAVRIGALDAVTKILEHLDILPKKESDDRRKRGAGNGYGGFGNVRYKEAGGNHFEYRTMSSWLHDPRVAFVCLTAAKLAASDPVATRVALEGATSFKAFQNWVETYSRRDDNAARAVRLFEKGHKALIKDPSEDLRGRWEVLGL